MRIKLVMLLGLLASAVFADFGMPHILSDNMVLQRNQPTRVWGWGANGSEVTVNFKEQSKSTVVRDGEWLVELPRKRMAALSN